MIFFLSAVAPNKAEQATNTLGPTKQKRKGWKERKRENFQDSDKNLFIFTFPIHIP